MIDDHDNKFIRTRRRNERIAELEKGFRGMKDVSTTKFNTVATNEECFFT